MTEPKANPLRLLLPPWRLGNNVRSASGDFIDGLSDGAVVAEWCFAALVVVGVIGEFIIAARHPPYDSWLGQWGPAYGDLLVAIGVAGEVVASVISHICQGELTRRSNKDLEQVAFDLAEANTVLAKTQREVVYLRTPRGGPLLAQADALVAALLPFKFTDFDIGLGANDGEQLDFVNMLVELLVRAEWFHNPWAARRMGVQPIWLSRPSGQIAAGAVAATNVELHVHPLHEAKLRPAADALAVSLHDMGIVATPTRYDCESGNDGAVHILVGPKS